MYWDNRVISSEGNFPARPYECIGGHSANGLDPCTNGTGYYWCILPGVVGIYLGCVLRPFMHQDRVDVRHGVLCLLHFPKRYHQRIHELAEVFLASVNDK